MGAVAARHASLQSVWFINSLRGALALAAAVAVAGLIDVQHGFWVALGALSVLRTSATSTGATAFRALAGTAAEMVIGSVVVLAIGSDTAVLWAMLDDALRSLLADPGTKHIPKEHLWRLVGATMRLRLTAHALARAQPTPPGFEDAKDALTRWTAGLVSWYDRLALDLAGDNADDRGTLEAALPAAWRLFDPTSDAAVPTRAMWIGEHLRGLP
jgi:hypothetical protein